MRFIAWHIALTASTVKGNSGKGERWENRSQKADTEKNESSLKENNSNMIPKFCFLVSQKATIDRDQKWQTHDTCAINNQCCHSLLHSQRPHKATLQTCNTDKILSTDQNWHKNLWPFLFRFKLFSLKKEMREFPSSPGVRYGVQSLVGELKITQTAKETKK